MTYFRVALLKKPSPQSIRESISPIFLWVICETFNINSKSNDMQKKYTAIALLLLMLVTTGCTAYLTRGFRAPADEDDVWKKRGISKVEVVTAMQGCGYTDTQQGYGEDHSINGYATRQECMFLKGFKRNDGRGGVCSNPEYRATLPACKNAPIRPRWE